MTDAVSPSANRIFNKGNIRTLLEILYLHFFGFIFTMGFWGYVSAILHILDFAVGIVAFNGFLIGIFLALGTFAVVVGGAGLALYFFARPLLRKFMFKDGYDSGSWIDIAYFPPIWVMLLIAIPAFIASVLIWPLTLIAGPTLVVILPALVPVPLILPAIFWIAYATSLKKTWMVPLALALLWGFLSTVPSLLFNSGIGTLFSLTSLGPNSLNFISTALVAPIVEETMKPLLLLLFLKYIKDERDGFAFGLTMGIGFAVLENFFYLINNPGLWGFLIMIRSYNMVLHAIGPAIIGYFIGKAQRKSQKKYFLLIPLGWFIGFVIHMIWNGTTVLTSILQNSGSAGISTMACFISFTFILAFPAIEWMIVFLVGRRAAKVCAKTDD